MSRRLAAIIIIIALTALFIFLYKSTSLQSKNKTSDLTFFLSFQAEDSWSILILSGSYILSGEENILQSTIAQHKENMQLRSWIINISYVSDTSTIKNFVIQEIHQSEELWSAYRTFINQLIVPRLHTNLIDSPTSLTLKSTMTPWLMSNHYLREYRRVDTQQTTQILQLSLKKSCSIYYSLWYTDSCSLKGNYILSTPLSSGPVVWTITGYMMPVLH